jgi:predicted Ser/Thr protein kinase
MSELLNDRYDLGDVVGFGGMGAVHRATDTRLGRTVAVKVLRGGALADEVARSRMRSEARLASSIHHPGVAQVFDYDDSSTSHPGMSFIVMEYIEGRSLAELLREHGPMPVDQVMSVVEQVADALAAAHAAGVVHRDLKPANIMLTPAGRTVLVDFGIASSSSSEPLTETGTLLGTADYFSPEQAAGRPATARSDLYSLGVVAHHCLTGSSPFRRDNQIATALAHIGDDLPPLGASVPARVRRLVTSLAEKNPDDRPQSAAVVAAEAAAIGAAPAVDMPRTSSLAAAQLPRQPRRRRSTALYSVAGVVVAALLLVGVDAARSDAPPAVPDVVGMDVDRAVTAITDVGMTARREVVDVPGVAADQVVQQSPEPGTTMPDDTAVALTVASGKVGVSADDILGSSYGKAAATLEKLGLVVARTDVPSSAKGGTVVALDRSGRLPDGSTITLGVATALPAPVATPARTAVRSSTSTSGSSSRTSGKSAPKATGPGKTKGKGKGRGKKK